MIEIDLDNLLPKKLHTICDVTDLGPIRQRPACLANH